MLPGRIELGLFFKEQIYFFASDTSRSMFRTNPRRYVDSAGMVELDVADIETSM